MNVNRRLEKIEAAIAPTANDEVSREIERIMAEAPPLKVRDDPTVERWRARWKDVSIPRLTDPRQQIELAHRLASARRRLFVHEHGEEALDAFDHARSQAESLE